VPISQERASLPAIVTISRGDATSSTAHATIRDAIATICGGDVNALSTHAIIFDGDVNATSAHVLRSAEPPPVA
jgi:hypothetical protein